MTGNNTNDGDTRVSVAWICSAIYAGLHLMLWDAHCPSYAEALLWRWASTAASATGLVVGLATSLPRSNPMQDQLSGQLTRDHRNEYQFRGVAKRYIIRPLLYSLAITVMLVATCGRCYLAVEAFISLGSQPESSYHVPGWTQASSHSNNNGIIQLSRRIPHEISCLNAVDDDNGSSISIEQ